MSVLDLSSLIALHTPEMLAPPPAPATPEIDVTEMQTSDANSSGTSFNSDAEGGASVSDQAAASGAVSVASRPSSSPYSSQADEAAALVLELSGGSLISVEDLEQSIPPSMAAAAALLNQITADGVPANEAAMGSLYTIIDSATVLALTSV